jgi:RNA 3'-terminal phosphate cyclase (GTP)
MIEIDGSYKEGGGQIVRTALALSTLLQKPCKITNIRKGRKNPGLKSQHLNCVKALRQLCNAKVAGSRLGSEELMYVPKKINAYKITIDIETAGSITLLLQSLLLPCLFSEKKKKIEIMGGTDVKWSPQIDYFKEVILPNFYKFAESIELNIEKRGYYPKGNGKVILKISPKYNLDNLEEFLKIDLSEQGNLVQIKGISHACFDLQKSEVAERQSKGAKSILHNFKVPVKIENHYFETDSLGSGITLWAVFSKDDGYSDPIKLGSDELGEKGVKAEEVGKKAANQLLEEINSKAAVDRHLADNLIPLLGLIKNGEMKTSEITDHSLSNIYVVEKFLGKKFFVEDKIIKKLV